DRTRDTPVPPHPNHLVGGAEAVLHGRTGWNVAYLVAHQDPSTGHRQGAELHQTETAERRQEPQHARRRQIVTPLDEALPHFLGSAEPHRSPVGPERRARGTEARIDTATLALPEQGHAHRQYEHPGTSRTPAPGHRERVHAVALAYPARRLRRSGFLRR